MVSWTRAFFLAFKAVVYAVIWAIVGSILVWAGASMGGWLPIPGIPHPTLAPPLPPHLGAAGGERILGIILVIIGFLVITLGGLASTIKVAVDEAEDQLMKKVGGG